MLTVVRRCPLVVSARLSSAFAALAGLAGLAAFAGFGTVVPGAGSLVACQRSDPPPGSPAEVAPCPEDAGTALPRELACCLIQARTGEDAQICLARADAGR
jgi:hypothetical protein